ncbi:transmembrane protein 179-like [Paramacrobiotus metropolitanus]|uniref:transmembrane protein 179-like n=1 Tax=Paramacrobiotus metropolitanus TaxID=2943436 RepID=UPI00244598D0|nr:transmembrane protein 179-like [Paramacrobiotus metropolitanus]XP_055332208.1 transmembrane protein 179-like [Paramacrobiotus metropolitanus]XP_055332209.1 transmembrane protein 179-like [Paramacrobiotus metropolitanus]
MQASATAFLLAQIVASLLVAILSFLLIVPVWMHFNAFNGHCALYSEAFSNSSKTPYPTSVSWSNGSACDFAIVLGIMALSVSVMSVVALSVRLYQGVESTLLSTIANTLVSMLFTILSLAGAASLTSGFVAWCSSLENASKFQDKCRVISYGFTIPGVIDNGSSFYIDLSIAKFGAWLLFGVWMCSSAMTGSRLYFLHRKESIFVGLKREWERVFPFGKSTQYKPVTEL